MKPKPRYASWGGFLKANREVTYRSAREFCAQMELGISYPQYSRYESGEQLPNLEQALTLCKILKLPASEGLLEWSLAQIEDEAMTREISELLRKVRTGELQSSPDGIQGGIKTVTDASLDEVLVFNRSHLKIFNSDPLYRDVFTYINSFGIDWISAPEISRALHIPFAKAERMVEKLSDLGVVLESENEFPDKRYKASKKMFYFPDDADFFDLKNLNLQHNTSLILQDLTPSEIQAKKAYRGLITRELTQEQVGWLVSQAEKLLSGALTLPEDPSAQSVFSVCLLIGKRFSRAPS